MAQEWPSVSLTSPLRSLLTHFKGYIVGSPNDSLELISIIDPAKHRERRKLWEPAFSVASIKSYTPLLRSRVEQLTTQFDNRLGHPLDIAEWLGLLSMDFMSDFCYGGFFDFTARGADHLNVHQFGLEGLKTMETLGTIPWMRPVMLSLPYPEVFKKWMAMSTGIVKNRMSKGSNIRDLSYYLVRPSELVQSSRV
jgi:cytochrome P450